MVFCKDPPGKSPRITKKAQGPAGGNKQREATAKRFKHQTPKVSNAKRFKRRFNDTKAVTMENTRHRKRQTQKVACNHLMKTQTPQMVADRIEDVRNCMQPFDEKPNATDGRRQNRRCRTLRATIGKSKLHVADIVRYNYTLPSVCKFKPVIPPFI